MPFASINPTLGKIHEIFMKKYWELAELENELFLVGHFDFFFASFPWKSVQIYMVEWMGPNFEVFPGFPENS